MSEREQSLSRPPCCHNLLAAACVYSFPQIQVDGRQVQLP